MPLVRQYVIQLLDGTQMLHFSPDEEPLKHSTVRLEYPEGSRIVDELQYDVSELADELCPILTHLAHGRRLS